jgi:hypothetical protein
MLTSIKTDAFTVSIVREHSNFSFFGMRDGKDHTAARATLLYPEIFVFDYAHRRFGRCI